MLKVNPKDLVRYVDTLLTLERSDRGLTQLSQSLAPNQAVHVVYGGTHLFRSDTIKKLTTLTFDSFNSHLIDDKFFLT